MPNSNIFLIKSGYNFQFFSKIPQTKFLNLAIVILGWSICHYFVQHSILSCPHDYQILLSFAAWSWRNFLEFCGVMLDYMHILCESRIHLIEFSKLKKKQKTKKTTTKKRSYILWPQNCIWIMLRQKQCCNC